VTLGRRGREPAGRADGGDPHWRAVEVEELAPQRVLGSRSRRPGSGQLLAVAGVTALLAVGLGVFGGRPTAHPAADALLPSKGAEAGSSETVGREVTPFPPIATPAVPCRPSTDPVPRAVLDVDGAETAPMFEEMDFGGPAAPDATAPDFGEVPAYGRTEIPAYARVSLRIADDACAVGWSIDLTDPNQAINLERVTNEERDPQLAQQNRFELPVARLRGADYNLIAQLTYADALRRAIWPIRILPFQVPMPWLLAGNRSLAVNQGCDLQLIIRGDSQLLSPCDGSLASPPPVTRVRAGAPLSFSFSEGWEMQIGAIDCGQLTGVEFVPEPDCQIPFKVTAGLATFEAAPVPGTWTVAISGCAVQRLDNGQNAVCGTWYAVIRVQA
jgi:hypothetical protein